MSLSNALVSLWLLPVAVQVVLPLAILLGFLGKRFYENLFIKREIANHHNSEVRQSV
jgi:hypothetical protein